MSCHVVTMLNPATSVSDAVKGRFMGPDREDLIVGKGSTVEVYSLGENTLHLEKEFSVCGIIRSLQVFQPNSESPVCSVFVLTDHNTYAIFSYNSNENKVVIDSKGVLEKENTLPSDQPVTVAVDHRRGVILVSIFSGFIFSIPYRRANARASLRPTALKTNELDINAMIPLYGVSSSSVAVLLGEIEEIKTIKLFRCDPGHIEENRNVVIQVEPTTHMLIPVPDHIGGIISVGEYIITYHDFQGGYKELSIEPVMVTSYAFIDAECRECLIADRDGNLYVLELGITNMKVTSITSTILGSIPTPNSLVSLGNGIIYCGSRQGDSTLIRLITDPSAKYRIKILQRCENIGPIVDFCIFDYNNQGKKTMVCCSGIDKDGSLRVVENGVGFKEEASMNIPFIDTVWTLKLGDGKRQHDTIVASTSNETVVITPFQDPTLAEDVNFYSAISLEEATLVIGNTYNGHIIQVTPSSVRLMSTGIDGTLLSQWRPPFSKTIAIAKLTPNKCVLYYESDALVCLQVENDNLVEKCSKEFKDISCIYIKLAEPKYHSDDYVLVGMGTSPNIFLLKLADFSVASLYTLETTTGTKDVALIQMNKKLHLLVLLGDGYLYYYQLEERLRLHNQRQTMMGTHCRSMFIFFEHEEPKIFVNGFQPTIISNLHGRLFFSAVNLKNITAASIFNKYLILVKNNQLLFGQTNEKQRFHYSTVSLDGDMPTRIEYQPTTKTLAVAITSKASDPTVDRDQRKGGLKILDAQNFQVLDTYSFSMNEVVESFVVTKFGDDDNEREFLFVGTAVDINEEPERSRGRVFVFYINDLRKCELITVQELPGIVYSMCRYGNSMAFGVNGSIFTLDRFQPNSESAKKLSIQSRLNKNVLAIYMDSKDNDVLVGDLIYSMALLKNRIEGDPATIERVAVENSPSWMCAVKIINENLFIGADDKNNLFTTTREENPDGMDRLEIMAGYQLGHLVNRFREGTLCYLHDGPIVDTNPITFVTVDGAFGVIQTIPEDRFEFLYEIQRNIADVSPFCNRTEHESWHRYSPPFKNLAPKPFIDGTLLKSFMTMNRSQRTRVMNGETLVPTTEKEIERQIVDIII
ncbi:hypothetical protein K501DRAFT_254965 [Backusella circina FSU 941]|nr:hypothetical protein K501DRAFT_254965 [Backusella circina FSU 941]